MEVVVMARVLFALLLLILAFGCHPRSCGAELPVCTLDLPQSIFDACPDKPSAPVTRPGYKWVGFYTNGTWTHDAWVPDVKPAPAAAHSVAGLHSHQCSRCGTTWQHGHDSYGNAAAHTCPGCGTLNWTPRPAMTNALAPPPMPWQPVSYAPRSMANCPGGT
jgi:hypothetical protein